MQLDYFYNTDIYQVNYAITNNLRLPYFQSSTKYGTGLMLNFKPNKPKTNANITLTVHLNSVNDVLIFKNLQEMLTIMNNSLATEYVNQHGTTERFGDKYIKKYVLSVNKKALKIIQDNILIIYDPSIINYVVLYSLKTRDRSSSSGSIVPIPEDNNWILHTNFWRDQGIWIDTDFWHD